MRAPDGSPPPPPSTGNEARPRSPPQAGGGALIGLHGQGDQLERYRHSRDPAARECSRGDRDGHQARVPLLVQDFFQQAPALPAAGPAAVQARTLRRQLEGAQAAPGGTAGAGGQAHLASQPLDLVQAQEPFGPPVLPQLLPEGFQPWGEGGRPGWSAGLLPEAGEGFADRGEAEGGTRHKCEGTDGWPAFLPGLRVPSGYLAASRYSPSWGTGTSLGQTSLWGRRA